MDITQAMLQTLEVGRMEALETLETQGVAMEDAQRVQFIAQAQILGELFDSIVEQCQEKEDDDTGEAGNRREKSYKRAARRAPLSNRTN